MYPDLQNLDYAEQMHAAYARDPASVPADWRQLVEGMARTNRGTSCPTASLDPLTSGLPERVAELRYNFRARGHKIAAIDPLGAARPTPPELEPAHRHFTEEELAAPVLDAAAPGESPLTVRETVARLRHNYCRSIGAQFMHIDDAAVRQWLQRRMESTQNRLALSHDEQKRIFTRLTAATLFEEFLRRQFAGAKTFSLEGCETLIPLLDRALEQAGAQGVREVIFGMAHRGRLNVLANIIGRNPCELFRNFADENPELWIGRGDVKYHLGHSGEWRTAAGREIHLSLCFNPSHLEFVNPVVLGRVRARQDRLGDTDRQQVLGVLIHGDAAFAGEGIVPESLNLAQLRSYSTGGTLHIVVNNQIGFTTSPAEGRSTEYATDVARLLQAPIFHVNGEDPEAVVQVVRLAMEFRAEFRQDVFIDLYGYRRWGHN